MATILDPDLVRTLDVLVAARRERLLAEARNDQSLHGQDGLRAPLRHSPEAPEFTGLGGTNGPSGDAMPHHPEAA